MYGQRVTLRVISLPLQGVGWGQSSRSAELCCGVMLVVMGITAAGWEVSTPAF